jgi:hypothetical protein
MLRALVGRGSVDTLARPTVTVGVRGVRPAAAAGEELAAVGVPPIVGEALPAVGVSMLLPRDLMADGLRFDVDMVAEHELPVAAAALAAALEAIVPVDDGAPLAPGPPLSLLSCRRTMWNLFGSSYQQRWMHRQHFSTTLSRHQRPKCIHLQGKHA